MAVPQSRWSRNPDYHDFFRDLPVTKIVIGIWVLSFLTALLKLPLNAFLVFDPHSFPNVITGLATYALVIGTDFLGLIFGAIILYQFGGFLERSWGWRTYLLFLIGASLASSIVWEAGIFLLAHKFDFLATPWFLLSAVIISWAWINPEMTVLLWFILPIKAKWLGWGTIALLFLVYPYQVIGASPLVPVLGIFALGGAAFALGFDWYMRKWAWIPRRSRKRSSKKPPLRHPASAPFGRLLHPFRDWQRRRRVAKLQRTFKLDD